MDGEGATATATATKGKGLKKWKRIQRRSFDGGGVAATDLNPFSKRTPTAAASDRRSVGVSSTITIAPKSNIRVHRTTISTRSSVETAAPNNNTKIKKKPRAAAAAAGSHQLDTSSNFSTNHRLAQSLLSIQDLHQSLQKEIQKFGEIGRETILLPDVDVYILKRKLEEVMSMLEVKESRVVELEGILHDRVSKKGEAEYLNDKCKEMESDLFKAKIEAEVECLTMRKTCQKLRASVGGQKTLIGEQNSILHKCRDAENKNVVMKEEEVDNNLASTEEVLKMRGGIWKCTLCFSFQLVLLVLVFQLLFLQLWPAGCTGLVPT